MNRKLNLTLVSAAVATSFALMPVLGQAADDKKMDKPVMAQPMTDKAAMPGAPADRMVYSDRANSKPWTNEKDVLKNLLKTGQDKAAYTKMLTDNGYQITSVNADKPDYVEYEVVKGQHSYEVQISLDKTAHTAKKIDIDSNLWRADSTKAAMRGTKLDQAPVYVATNDRFSDRTRMKAWAGDKERLEKALPLGQDKAAYAALIKKQGYQITSTNEAEKDYLEYEIVKGDNSYEVQIDLENGKGKKVDVTTNMWQSEATEKALAMHNKK